MLPRLARGLVHSAAACMEMNTVCSERMCWNQAVRVAIEDACKPAAMRSLPRQLPPGIASMYLHVLEERVRQSSYIYKVHMNVQGC